MDPETIGVKAAGENLNILIDRVDADGQEFIITRWRRPVAVLKPYRLAEMRPEAVETPGRDGPGAGT